MKSSRNKVKKIEIVLENCEVYEFDGKDASIVVEGLGEHIYGGDVFEVAKHTCILIDKDAKAIGDFDNADWQGRIHKDITQVHLHYESGENECYYTDWGDSEYENEYETDIDDGDRMVYVISKEKKSYDDF